MCVPVCFSRGLIDYITGVKIVVARLADPKRFDSDLDPSFHFEKKDRT